MSEVKAIAKLMQELEDQLVVCMRCGMCQAVCPVFTQTGREADVARGKLALLDGLLHEMFKDPDGVSERLNRCLLCGSCAANCPSGVKVLDIFLKARAILTGFMGLSPAKRLVLRGMLSRPALFDRVADWAGRFQKLITKPANEIIGTSCARFASPLLDNRHFRLLSSTAYHRRVPSMSTAAGASGKRAAFFVGCLIDKIFPNIAEATVKVLTGCGVGIHLPAGQGCCGIPALSSGDREKVLPNIQDINMIVTELEEKIESLKTECPADWSPQKKEIDDAHVDMRSKYEDTMNIIGKASPVSIPG